METNFVHADGAEVVLAVLGLYEECPQCKWLSWLTILNIIWFICEGLKWSLTVYLVQQWDLFSSRQPDVPVFYHSCANQTPYA